MARTTYRENRRDMFALGETEIKKYAENEQPLKYCEVHCSCDIGFSYHSRTCYYRMNEEIISMDHVLNSVSMLRVKLSKNSMGCIQTSMNLIGIQA